MKSKFQIAALAGTAVLAASFGATTAQAATATAKAKAKVVSAVTVQQVAGKDLDFGTIVPGTGLGTIVLTAEATTQKTCTGMTCAGSVGSAQFTVAGAPNTDTVVSLPTAPLELVNGGAKLEASLSGPTGLRLDANGAANLFVGGTLRVPAGAAEGVYESLPFNVNVEYK